MKPVAAVPPATPFTRHVTGALAAKVRDAPGARVALGGVMVNAGAWTVTTAVAYFAGSTVLTARIATVCGVGGAVYTPAAVMKPVAALPPGTSFTSHAAGMLAAKVREAPVVSVALGGVIVIDGGTTF